MFIIVFVNDILVYSKMEHKLHFSRVLVSLRENIFYVTFSRCEFWLQHVSFLGHIVSTDEVLVDPLKVKTIIK